MAGDLGKAQVNCETLAPPLRFTRGSSGCGVLDLFGPGLALSGLGLSLPRSFPRQTEMGRVERRDQDRSRLYIHSMSGSPSRDLAVAGHDTLFINKVIWSLGTLRLLGADG